MFLVYWCQEKKKKKLFLFIFEVQKKKFLRQSYTEKIWFELN